VIAIAFLSLLAAPTRVASCPVTPPASIEAYPIRIPIEVFSNHVYVKICSGERELDFVLDTGAGQNFLDMRIARANGVSLGVHFIGRGAGAGTIDGAMVSNVAVAIENTAVSVPIGAALDLSGLPPREGHRIDGILGYSFISRYVVVIDYVHDELRLYDPDRFAYSGPGTSIPVTFASNHPVISAGIRLSDGSTLDGRFVVDVGAAPALSLTWPFVQSNRLRSRIDPLLRRIGGGGVGGPTESYEGRVPVLRLGGLELHDVITNLYGESAGLLSGNGGWIGNIGADILRRFTVYLDYRHKRIILEPHAGTNEPFESDMSGAAFMLAESGNRLVVADVTRPSPASEAGLVVGDTVVAVDGATASEDVLVKLRQRLRHDGENVELALIRGGATKIVRLRTRRLI
jgi:hypothetical protein